MFYSNRRTRIRLLASVLVTALTVAIPSIGSAQDNYPNRPITLVIPYGPGGETDIFARAISNDVAKELGQPIVVVNRAGATGVVACEFVARSAPDGYTIIFGTAATHALNMSTFKNLPYHPLKDFSSVAFVGSVPLVLYAHPSMPAKPQEFINELKAHPSKYFYGSAGVSTSYLGMELFKNAAKVSVTNAPYKGTGESIQGLLGNQVQMLGGSLGAGQTLVQGGRLQAIAVMSNERLAAAPQIPTFKESVSLPLDVGTWNVVMAPKGTPKAIVDRLNAAFNVVLSRPSVVERLAASGIQAISDSTPDSTAARISSEIEKWAEAAKLAGVQPQ